MNQLVKVHLVATSLVRSEPRLYALVSSISDLKASYNQHTADAESALLEFEKLTQRDLLWFMHSEWCAVK